MIKTAGEFTSSLKKEVKPIYKKLLKHPFSKGLQNGTLKKSAFRHYLSQDILYLRDDYLSIKNISKRIKNKKQKAFFHKISKEMLELEVIFTKKLLKKFKTKKAKKKSKVIKAYGDFLVNSSKNSSVNCSLASLLPCFWLYSAVGLKIHKKAKKQNQYKEWIEFYYDAELIKNVNYFIKIVEKRASKLSKNKQNKMKKYFLKASKYELDFFNEAIKIGEKR